MSETTRPSISAVQRTLIIGILAGGLLGCILGSVIGVYYAWQVDPAVYSSGAYPSELTANYQDHYLAMVVDSYTVNRDLSNAQKRLKTFDTATKISALGKWSAFYSISGRAVETQAVNELAAALKQAENWPPEVVADEMTKLAADAQSDSTRLQAIKAYGVVLGVVPQEAGQPSSAQPTEQATAAPPSPPAQTGGWDWLTWVGTCLLILLALVAIVLLLGRWQQQRKKAVKAPPVAWEGEGPPPLKHWSGTYTFGQDNYDEFFTIETEKGDFLGESGMGILKTVPGTSPKQVTAFDVGLFDKTDITTLSRVVMSEQAYNDSSIRAEISPQAEVVLAEPGKKFTLETSAMRVAAKIDELEYGPGGNVYFNKLKLSLDVFVKEGVDLRIGTMDIPDQYK